MAAEIITSSNNGRKLIYNGNIFYRRDSNKGRTYWRCARTKECSATAITAIINNTVSVLKEGKHDHAPNQEAAAAELVVNRIKRSASAHPQATPAQILRQELPRVPSGVIAHMPERENLKKQIRRERRKDLPPEPVRLEDLAEIPERFRKTQLGDKFLLYDSYEDDDVDDGDDGRVIVFATQRNIQLLQRSPMWFLDGTFKTSPNLFTQVRYCLTIITVC